MWVLEVWKQTEHLSGCQGFGWKERHLSSLPSSAHFAQAFFMPLRDILIEFSTKASTSTLSPFHQPRYPARTSHRKATSSMQIVVHPNPRPSRKRAPGIQSQIKQANNAPPTTKLLSSKVKRKIQIQIYLQILSFYPKETTSFQKHQPNQTQPNPTTRTSTEAMSEF